MGDIALPLTVARTVTDLRAAVAAWRKQGLKIGLVPTMGALHEGHLTLVRRARQVADRVVVSLFVNPTQFGPNEDFQAYPRQEEADAHLLRSVGADLLYAPEIEDIYPAGFATTVSVAGLTDGLCGTVRPGHFAGVATVVAKLLLRALPDIALFGEKDYQQLQVIKRLTLDLDIPVAIEGVPTVREADGLALSSRNAYLSPEQRAAAPVLYKVISRIAAGLAAGHEAAPLLEGGRAEILEAGFASVDYLEARDADTL
ncbi:MAG: pantoate--beta-alanine ligase, partial [Rhodospirillales bacterium]|nr:pantoate--beta-alanine ligase [Rhodospirillales bacterium]